MNDTFNIKCPRCQSTELRSLDVIVATADIVGWSVDAGGGLVPAYSGESVVHWDTQEAQDANRPYECSGCDAKLSESDLLAARDE